MAKNGITLLKQLTIPKLQLCAAVLGARLCNHTTTSIKYQTVFLWSDSQITLRWISSSKKQTVFVSNRVREIQELTKNYQWRFCPTDSNTEDLLSRGLSYDKFEGNRLWFNGPDWLKDETSFPVSSLFSTSSKTHEERNESTAVLLNRSSSFIPGILHVIDLQRFSSCRKVLRVCANILRLVDQYKQKRTIKGDHLESQELDTAAKMLIQHVQCTKLYVVEVELLPERTKFPYLLPPSGKLTELIIIDAHQTRLHCIESTVTYLRQRFWIQSLRQRVRAIVRTDTTYRKVTGPAYRVPDPPPLPIDILKQAAPFTVTGIDFTGALTVQSARGDLQKVYICLFTCSSTRAIHLGIVSKMTTNSFILALRRFMSRNSNPRVIMSDNALTYLATANILKKVVLNENGITWKFIPKHVPWYGGWWERLLGITKTCLKKVLGKSLVSLDMLQTIITKAE